MLFIILKKSVAANLIANFLSGAATALPETFYFNNGLNITMLQPTASCFAIILSFHNCVLFVYSSFALSCSTLKRTPLNWQQILLLRLRHLFVQMFGQWYFSTMLCYKEQLDPTNRFIILAETTHTGVLPFAYQLRLYTPLSQAIKSKFRRSTKDTRWLNCCMH